MIRTALGPDAPFYRCITPKWAYDPTSGKGAAIAGGRFNRPGVEALYLAEEAETALAEYRQDASLLPPGLLATFEVSLAHVVDFRQGFNAGDWAPEWQDWGQNWRRIARLEGRDPPSWHLSDHVQASGAAGLLYPSLRREGGSNLVVYPRNFGESDGVQVHDPDGRLPRDQTSWGPTSQ